ncbi:RagB/SusD family nutrient uptake outer membrane protein [Larkinella rosea]|uniref:RagB/SusD family nutrient uptake outer membrane protein n=1 Tax=Larkinella rosea TaxID=2025312 RepID=A0A3P1BDH6_9BACT|nr:RagB/SusD family nutrient uptake outer membrane protein [Larkinella rosea]RRA99159.1 RagB/SusD family nutrient uptake outer membrane protein [Larkinella rosea]
MKKLNNKMLRLAALFLIGFAVNGCNTLDQKPESALAQDGFYSNGTDAELGLIGTYNRLFTENHIVGTYMLLDMNSDDLTTGAGKFGYLMETRTDMSSVNNGTTDTYFNAPWVTIANANLFLEKVKDIAPTAFVGATTANDKRKDEVLGEAHFIRGLSYYYLAMLWRNVPLILDFPSGALPEENQKPSVPQSEVLAQVVKDLQVAETNLPNSLTQFSANERRGRASKWAAKGFLSRIRLQEKNWAEVVKLSDEIINSNQFTLTNPWTTMFLGDQNSAEAILEIQAEAGPGFFNMGIHGWYYGNGEFRATDDAVAQYEKPRKDVRYENVIKDDKVSNKFLPQPLWANEGIARANLVMLRLGEIYFNKAEALNELSYETNKQAVLAILNTFRARAQDPNFANRFRPTLPVGTTGIPLLTLADVDTQEKMRQAIRAEKRRELMFEGVRWLDLLRWDPTYAAQIVKASSPDRLYFPIPENEILLNKGVLKQNPGW